MEREPKNLGLLGGKTIDQLLTNQRFTEIEVGDDRERRSALLDWDGDYSQFQRDEVGKALFTSFLTSLKA